MSIKNKYKNKDEFIKACKNDPLIKPLLASKYISDITGETLRKYGIKQNFDNYFHKSQVFELLLLIRNDLKKQYGKVPTELTEIPKFEFIKHIDSDAPGIQRFLLLTLSDKFNDEVKEIRRKNGIPEDGFSDNKQYNLWLKKPKLEYSQLQNEVVNLFWKYKLRMGFAPMFYMLWEFNNQRIFSFLRETAPFHTPTKYTVKKSPHPNEIGKTSWGIPNDLYGIMMTRPVTKKALKKYVDKNWQRIKEEMNIFYMRVPLAKDFKRNWLIYKYHKVKKTNRDIVGILKFEYKMGNLKEPQTKQIIMRLKREIAELEKVT